MDLIATALLSFYLFICLGKVYVALYRGGSSSTTSPHRLKAQAFPPLEDAPIITITIIIIINITHRFRRRRYRHLAVLFLRCRCHLLLTRDRRPATEIGRASCRERV